MKTKKLAEPFGVSDEERFRLKDFDQRAMRRLPSRESAAEILEAGLARLTELQAKLLCRRPLVTIADLPRKS